MTIDEYEKQLTKQKDNHQEHVEQHYHQAFSPAFEREYQTVFSVSEPRNLRGTGRTTRMVFQALIHASEGKDVYIVAHNAVMAREIRRMVETVAKSIHWGRETLPTYVYKITYINSPREYLNLTIHSNGVIVLYDNAIEDLGLMR